MTVANQSFTPHQRGDHWWFQSDETLEGPYDTWSEACRDRMHFFPKLHTKACAFEALISEQENGYHHDTSKSPDQYIDEMIDYGAFMGDPDRDDARSGVELFRQLIGVA